MIFFLCPRLKIYLRCILDTKSVVQCTIRPYFETSTTAGAPPIRQAANLNRNHPVGCAHNLVFGFFCCSVLVSVLIVLMRIKWLLLFCHSLWSSIITIVFVLFATTSRIQLVSLQRHHSICQRRRPLVCYWFLKKEKNIFFRIDESCNSISMNNNKR